MTAKKTIAQPRYSRLDIVSPRSIAEPRTPKTDSSDISIEAAAGFTLFWAIIWSVYAIPLEQIPR